MEQETKDTIKLTAGIVCGTGMGAAAGLQTGLLAGLGAAALGVFPGAVLGLGVASAFFNMEELEALVPALGTMGVFAAATALGSGVAGAVMGGPVAIVGLGLMGAISAHTAITSDFI